MGLDFHFKTWKWSQWLATLGLIQFLVMIFYNVYIYINGINFRITLLIFGILLLSLYDFLYIIGFFTDYEKKTLQIQLLIPFAAIAIDLLFFLMLKRAVRTLTVNYISFLILAVSYLFYAGTIYLCYNKVEFTYEDLSDMELFELGVIDEDPRLVKGGKSVAVDAGSGKKMNYLNS